MEALIPILVIALPIAAGAFLLWLALRFVRAVERIADGLGD